MRFLRQSTASQEILLGPFVAAADGSAQTGLTIANTDIQLLKGGATSEASKNSGGGTHIAGGRYSAVLDATDTNTVGILEVSVNPASGIPWNKSYYVLEEAVYDMLFAASALGYIANAPVNVAQFGGSNGTFASGRPEVNATHWGGTAVASANVNANVTQISGDSTAADNLESYCDGTTPQPVNVTQLSGDATAADNAEAFFDGTGYAGTNNVIPTVTNVTNLHASAATAAELAKVPKSDGSVSWNATALAAIQAEAEDALAAYDPPTKAELDAAVANVSVDEIQPSALADLFNTDSGTTYGSAVSGSVVKEIADNAGGSSLTAADIADAVWDEALSGHDGAGSAGEALAAAGTAGDPWTTALPGSYSSGQAGYIIGTNLDAAISSRASQTSVNTVDGIVDDILADTADMQPKLGSPAGASISADIAAVKAQTAAIEADTQDLQTQVGTDGAGLTNIPWNASWDAEVQSECADALNAYDPPTRAEMTSDTNSVLSAVGDVPTNSEFEARTLAAASYATASDLATVDGNVDAIKAKTDSLTFTKAGEVDANVQSINGVTITGDGQVGTEFGV